MQLSVAVREWHARIPDYSVKRRVELGFTPGVRTVEQFPDAVGQVGMRVVVDGVKCQGHGRCYDLAPDMFEPDERGRVDLAVTGDLPPGLEPDAQIAVRTAQNRLAAISAPSAER